MKVTGDRRIWVLYRFKSCPRCNGDVYLDRDEFSWYEQCLQCGFMNYMEKLIDLKKRSVSEEEAAAMQNWRDQ
jgi:hypothetical protein